MSETGKCKWCDRESRTSGTGGMTEECNRCWQLRFRMEEDLLLSVKILGALFREQRGDALVLKSAKEERDE